MLTLSSRGPLNGDVNTYATVLEQIAYVPSICRVYVLLTFHRAANHVFRDQFGHRFHRDSVHALGVTPTSTPGSASRYVYSLSLLYVLFIC